MKNADLMVNGPDQRTHYNAIQLALPVFTPAVLPADDKVFSFLDAVKGVDFSHYVKPILSHNTHSHDRGMLVRVLLFGFMDNVLSLRELEQRCKTDIRYIYLSREKHPSKMAFSRVCQSLTMSIQDLFFDLSEKLVRKMGIDPNVQYVDGTKIEANAQKNTFVYKKRIINARKRMYGSISDEIRCLNQAYGYDYALKKAYCAQEVWYIVQYLMEVMVHEQIEICYGTGKRKSAFQKHYDLLMKYAMKLDEYEYWLFVIGDRRSCSKTDLDATFMATKWDYYNRSGVTRPCYNCQIAVSDGIIVNSDIFQSPGDTVTWEPFMERWKKYHGTYPEYPVADAGYGGYDNYLYNLKHGIHLVQKYGMYGKENDKQFQKRIYNQLNWPATEEGYKICPGGRVFSHYELDTEERTRAGNLSICQIYTEPSHCDGCPHKKECLSRFNHCGYRKLSRNVVREELYDEARKELGTPEGRQMKINRDIQVEGAFGVIKQNMRFTRFHRRGMKNVKMEFLLVCLGYDLMKYHCWRMKRHQLDSPYLLN